MRFQSDAKIRVAEKQVICIDLCFKDRIGRNQFLQIYSIRPGQAAKVNAPGWDWYTCADRQSNAEVEETDADGHHMLILAVFNPDLYLRYRQAVEQ